MATAGLGNHPLGLPLDYSIHDECGFVKRFGKKSPQIYSSNCTKIFRKALRRSKCRSRRPGPSGQKLRLPSALVAIFGRGLPDASAILGLPSQIPAGGLEVLGGGFGSCLGLGVLDFVEVHIFYLLFFCNLIIAQGAEFVNPFFIFL